MDKVVHKKLSDFVTSLVGLKLLHIYMSRIGIKQFQTNTMVPMALLLGKREFRTFIDKVIQRGGGFSSSINIMEDPLTNNYLKLAGLIDGKIDKNTLIPLGILKFIHNMHEFGFTQKNGELTQYIKGAWDENILTLLKKHHGVTTLTTSTLVPLAIIMPKKDLINYLVNKQDMRVSRNSAPFIQDPLLNNYFRLIGLSKKNVYISTLVPLGIIVVLHHIYE